MRIALSLLIVVTSLALAGFLYQQVVVEGEVGPAAIIGTVLLGTIILTLVLLTYLAGTRYREGVKNSLLAFSVMIVVYFAIDFVAGQFLIVSLSPPLVPDDYRHHVLVPDSYAELRQRDFSYIQRVNKLGLRGHETTVDKPADTRRVIMLGDSFTMGKGVEDDETFSILIEELLKDSLRSCSGGSVEVLNGGVDSYAPILSYIQLERDLISLAPDLVVLNFDNSDLIQEQAYRQQAVREDDGTILAVPQIGRDSLYERSLSWTTRNLYFTRIMLVYAIRAMDHQEVSVRRVVNEFGREHLAHTLEGDVDRSAQWRDVFDSIERVKRLTESNNAQFLLTTYPWAHQVNATDWTPGRYMVMEEGERTSGLTQQTVREYSATLGIDLFEALPVFQEYDGSEPLYFDFDPHWTLVGHKVMADGLAHHIAEHYIPIWCEAG